MLQLVNLHFDYQEQPLLHNVNFRLDTGELVHLKGANGAGKTTLLKLISGLYRPLEGDIYYESQSIFNDLSAYQRQLCFVGHKSGINPKLTLRENCYFDLHYPNDGFDLDALAALFKLHKHLEVPCGLLSAGQRRLAGLFRLWLTDAKLWLLDEPLVALDNMALKLIMAKIMIHREQGGAVLLTSHQQLSLASADYREHCL